ncbi:MAG TPA: DivIVA domain-containing protein [Clostridia bacterium]|nr:DivIVA domain-containing protein [Clostridia bacterium]
MDKKKIIDKDFQRSFLGYDVEEVDAFLDEIIRDMDRQEQEMGVLRLRVRMLLEELACRGPVRRAPEEPETAPALEEAAPEEPMPEESILEEPAQVKPVPEADE